MKKITLIVSLLSFLTGAKVFAENLADVSINERMYPDPNSHFSKVIDLQNEQLVSSVSLLTDWWQKRPTEIRVYRAVDSANGKIKGKLIGMQEFLTYDNMVCGNDYQSLCSYPDAPVGQLIVPVYANAKSMIVEIDGLLSPANGFVILQSLLVK
ncbi:MAG: hypothetical protein AAGB12_14650 [Pseudomonadota bacterium]